MVTLDGAWPAGTPCWVDLGVDDIGRAGAFYAAVFGWEIQPGPPQAGGYAMCLLRGRAVAGIGPKQGPPGTPSAWTVYLASDDVDQTARRITTAGGQLLMDPMDVMDVGRMTVAADPGGAVFGVWQAGSHTGVGLANEPGALCWNENFSRDLDRNRAFYRDVFGYEFTDLPGMDFRYATINVAGAGVGGIGEIGGPMPADVPPHWSTYFAVTDTDATIGTITAHAGAVLRQPWDTPFGRLAIVSDDQGAVFSLIAMAPPAG